MSSVFQRLDIRTIAIWASNEQNIIGLDNDIPWHAPSDLRFYAANTRDAVVIMGRNTYQSLPEVATKNRHIIVLTSKRDQLLGVMCAGSMDEAVGLAVTAVTQLGCKREIYFAGGARVYQEALRLQLADEILHTQVGMSLAATLENHQSAVFAPTIPAHRYQRVNAYKVAAADEPPLTFTHYMRAEDATAFGIVRSEHPTNAFYKALASAKLL